MVLQMVLKMLFESLAERVELFGQSVYKGMVYPYDLLSDMREFVNFFSRCDEHQSDGICKDELDCGQLTLHDHLHVLSKSHGDYLFKEDPVSSPIDISIE